jgi:hypothetical protein
MTQDPNGVKSAAPPHGTAFREGPIAGFLFLGSRVSQPFAAGALWHLALLGISRS